MAMWQWYVLALAAAAAAGARAPEYPAGEAALRRLFQQFVAAHGKQYATPAEAEDRFRIFARNVHHINRRNRDPLQTAVFDINKFTDLTEEEFLKFYTGFKPQSIAREEYVDIDVIAAPEELDWRKKNAVNEPEYQGYCGSCWAFGSTGAVEGAYALKHGSLPLLSKSQLVDCDTDNNGCEGGYMQNAIAYLQNAGGQMSEADYPYQPVERECKFDKNKIKVKVEKMLPFNLTGEEDTKSVLVKTGPITVGTCHVYHSEAISAGADVTEYQGGILRKCGRDGINHAVLLIGYGQENGVKYYILKNSWGSDWGEGGFFRVEMDDNPCLMYNAYAAGAEVA